MESTNSIAVKSNLLSRIQIKETVLILSLSVLMPFLIHFLPDYNGIPIGAILLPMFWAPYIAAKFFKFHVGLIAALTAPIMNYWITGNPQMAIVSLMTVQLALFVIVSALLKNIGRLQYLNAVLSYLIAVTLSAFIILVLPLLMPGMILENYFISAIVSGLPGIVLLAVINYASVKLNKK